MVKVKKRASAETIKERQYRNREAAADTVRGKAVVRLERLQGKQKKYGEKVTGKKMRRGY